MVLYLKGDEKVSVDLIADSIRILEAAGEGESFICFRRMQQLAQMYTKSNRFAEAEALLRKILHIMELSKQDAELLALALETAGRLREAEELLGRCLDARRNLLPDDHIQSVKMHINTQFMKTDDSQTMAELDKAENLLLNSTRSD
ncbi:hypothetical protein OROGR_008196 [Orobanche gracilis]